MNTFKGLLRRWWFWVVVVLLIPIIWYVWGYVTWQLDRQDMLAGNRSAYLGWLKMESDQAALEAQYRTDTYGGDTPEETLRLFVEALEKKDFELAAKYYVPQRQDEELGSINVSDQKGFIDEYIRVVRHEHKISYSADHTAADIDFYDDTGAQVHFAQMILNPFTKRWKFESI